MTVTPLDARDRAVDPAKMRVLFSSTRGAGHLHPLLPYARAIAARQHQVMVAAPHEVSELVRAAELVHAPFDHPGDDALGPIWARLRSASPDDAMVIAASEIFAGANVTAAMPKLQETISAFRPDLVVRESFEFGSLIAAELAGVRHARVAVHSVSFEEGIASLVCARVDALRELAGLAPDDGAALRAEQVFSSFPASLDRVLIPSRMQHPFRPRAVEDAPSSADAPWAPRSKGDFRPLVYITFGTLVGTIAHLRSVYRTALDAVAELPVRALLTTGHGLDGHALGTIPANVHITAWVPQRDVMPLTASLVCHGGSGTLLGGLAAGVPMVIIPHGADQPHNGRLVAAAGAGLALSHPDARALRDAIQRTLEAPELGREARRLSVEIAAMPTIDSAIASLIG